MPRIFISTGEVSGDLQGSLLIEALYRQTSKHDVDLEIIALGGDRMKAAGATLLENTSAIGSVGLLETLPFILPTVLLQRRVEAYLRDHPPDVVVLIDYFGANVRIARFIRRQFPGVPMVYYISPQEWVWSVSLRNTQRIVEMSDRLLAIFPEEARYYSKHGANVTWLGHPLLDRVEHWPTRAEARNQLGIDADQLAIALIPASRRQEIKYLMPVMFAAAQQIQAQRPEVRFWIPLSLETYRPAIEAAIRDYGLQATIVNISEQAIAAADLALTKSGTVNLELALMNVPQVVVYRVSPVTAWIATTILKFSIPFMSPANIVLMESIVPEFLQDAATPEAIAQTALELLQPEHRQSLTQDYQRMRDALGQPGACDRAALEILACGLIIEH
ncbi:MAG: lipid-A-disaccharide synthase [Synechococcales cyanobacterium T60_A2020_003]|nr:lipid-A-disaccharide synthase [Synechococcales cyanobacterium T60_A2020_003]